MTKLCENRIKPKMLRDVKTEALLVFIRTTLESFFKDLEENKANYILGTVEENKTLESLLKNLLSDLQKHVVNSKYILTLTFQAQTSIQARRVLKQEEPLIVYYNALIKQLELNLSQGQSWIPEQLVLCLLSEWILEEEKSVSMYPFLLDINYIDILSKYDQIAIDSKKNNNLYKQSTIKNMYLLGNELIAKLKKIKFKTNTARKSKFRK